MLLRYQNLKRNHAVFKSMTGLGNELFDEVVEDVEPRFLESELLRLSRPNRQRGIGGGREQELCITNQILMTIVWLRCYPKQDVLGYLFGVSPASVSRILARVLPLLAASGRDTMRMPDPGRKRRRDLDELLVNTPELAVIIDTFEQRVQRHKERSESQAHYSGKKKQNTLKSQVAVDEDTGMFADVSESVPGPTADINLLKQSGLLARLPTGVGALADLAYVGIDKIHPQGLGATPKRKPRSKERPPEDILFNRAFSQRRIQVEHSIGLIRRYEALSQMDRHHRSSHTHRVIAVCGLANRRLALRFRLPALL